jgi:hypothetical protein
MSEQKALYDHGDRRVEAVCSGGRAEGIDFGGRRGVKLLVVTMHLKSLRDAITCYRAVLALFTERVSFPRHAIDVMPTPLELPLTSLPVLWQVYLLLSFFSSRPRLCLTPLRLFEQLQSVSQ